MKKIVLTGGGTAGHITPNLALVPDLKKGYEIYYMGQKNSMEEKLTKPYKEIKFIPIKSVKLERKITPKNLLIPFKMIKYISETKKLLKEIKPNIIFAKGGFVSLPVVLAASQLKIPILAHESDFTMGLANKIILKKCKVMFTSFRETCISDKCIYSGSPVRDEIFTGNKNYALKLCNFSSKKPVIMFFGGSSGSKSINNFVYENIKNLQDYNIIHIIGNNSDIREDLKTGNYYPIKYATNIYDFYALADVVICRAGSNSIFELLALKKPMILIPLPAKNSRGDQIENANIFKKNNYAKVIFEEELTFKKLNQTIEYCLNNSEKIKNDMSTYKALNANKIILDYIVKY